MIKLYFLAFGFLTLNAFSFNCDTDIYISSYLSKTNASYAQLIKIEPEFCLEFIKTDSVKDVTITDIKPISDNRGYTTGNLRIFYNISWHGFKKSFFEYEGYYLTVIASPRHSRTPEGSLFKILPD